LTNKCWTSKTRTGTFSKKIAVIFFSREITRCSTYTLYFDKKTECNNYKWFPMHVM
jgi:hypothetical protein